MIYRYRWFLVEHYEPDFIFEMSFVCGFLTYLKIHYRHGFKFTEYCQSCVNSFKRTCCKILVPIFLYNYSLEKYSDHSVSLVLVTCDDHDSFDNWNLLCHHDSPLKPAEMVGFMRINPIKVSLLSSFAFGNQASEKSQ